MFSILCGFFLNHFGLTYSLEREVTLEDHLADLCEDGTLGVVQVHLPDACVSHTVLVLVLGLLRLPETSRHRGVSGVMERTKLQITLDDSLLSKCKL